MRLDLFYHLSQFVTFFLLRVFAIHMQKKSYNVFYSDHIYFNILPTSNILRFLATHCLTVNFL